MNNATHSPEKKKKRKEIKKTVSQRERPLWLRIIAFSPEASDLQPGSPASGDGVAPGHLRNLTAAEAAHPLSLPCCERFFAPSSYRFRRCRRRWRRRCVAKALKNKKKAKGEELRLNRFVPSPSGVSGREDRCRRENGPIPERCCAA